jgi:hypothetical protein
VRETRRLTHDDANAGAPIATGTQLLDATLIEHRRRRGAVLGEDLRELAASLEGGSQDPLQHVLFYKN